MMGLHSWLAIFHSNFLNNKFAEKALKQMKDLEGVAFI